MDKLAIARELILRLVPEIKSEGAHRAADERQPSTWTKSRDGVLMLYMENVLLLPDDIDVSCILDIWPMGERKVFSVTWMPTRPWLPPRVVRFKQGEWISRVK